MGIKGDALPPGTGVIHEALFFASPYSTSPTSRFPDFFVLSMNEGYNQSKRNPITGFAKAFNPIVKGVLPHSTLFEIKVIFVIHR